ncbi:hypothetical protein PLESTB_001812600 [Pleodorina starrii]|uniref:Uncharacterized protein n=1 Tax=Pleodorina starrii TaxID=330485 RepID=A0A9W6C0S9_9CHLO|nr:hypothetical protein PLESTM_001398600 [Pleodorina starrii]GLC61869.1 hypothetical protein PLESTB_001812600 [Pleodorina starrii]GLC75934.1 hypothetical protein PLESTF_001707700 [Pleodorina starrii]
MAQLAANCLQILSHNTRHAATPCFSPVRPPPTRLRIATTEVQQQPECSTSYQPTCWSLNLKRGSRVQTCAKKRNPLPEPPQEDDMGPEELVLQSGPPGDLQRLLSRRSPPGHGGASGGGDAEGGDEEAEGTEEGGGPAIPRVHMDMDIYSRVYGDQDSTWRDLPMRLLPRSEEEERRLQAALQMEAYFARTWNHEEVDDLAFFEAERMRGKAHNIYANVHQVAAMMRVLENADFRMGDKQTYFSSWSRAEILFAQDFDQFNQAVKDNMDKLVRQPLEEELRDRLEAIGEATLLPPTEAEQAEPKFPSSEDVSRYCVDNFLEGVLPGVSLANPTERYADDIYGGEGELADELFNMKEAEEDSDVEDGQE